MNSAHLGEAFDLHADVLGELPAVQGSVHPNTRRDLLTLTQLRMALVYAFVVKINSFHDLCIWVYYTL